MFAFIGLGILGLLIFTIIQHDPSFDGKTHVIFCSTLHNYLAVGGWCSEPIKLGLYVFPGGLCELLLRHLTDLIQRSSR